MKLLIVIAVIAIAVTGLALHCYSANSPAYVVIHKGQAPPKHYIAKWVFGNSTIFEVKPDSTTVTVAPWSGWSP